MFELAGRYCGYPSPDVALASQWNGDPVLLSFLAALLVPVLRADRRGAAMLCWAALVLAFASPLCALGSALFSARAVHHLILFGVAGPAAALAWRRRRAPIGPWAALVVSTLVLWGWHFPAAYDAALANKAIYWAMQATLLSAAWLFWSAVATAAPAGAATAVAGGAAQMGMLGAILTFAPRPLYASHLDTTLAFGMGPLADQQLAGLLMWTAGMIPYAAAAGLIALGGWRRLGAGSGAAAGGAAA